MKPPAPVNPNPPWWHVCPAGSFFPGSVLQPLATGTQLVLNWYYNSQMPLHLPLLRL